MAEGRDRGRGEARLSPLEKNLRQAVRGEGLDYQWRGLKQISPHLVDAAIAAEDARFCSHHGFDMEAIQKALDHNAEGGRIRGGSTISQQTAKNVFLWPGRDWIRKGLEAGYTVLIEAVWSKRRIMEVYLNVVEWAPGVYGAQAASRHWFGKDARDLSPREAARLAAILPAPRRYQAAAPGIGACDVPVFCRGRPGRPLTASRSTAFGAVPQWRSCLRQWSGWGCRPDLGQAISPSASACTLFRP